MVPTRTYTQSAKLTSTFDPVIKINTVPPLIIRNLHVKFESDWAKTVACISPQGLIHRVPKLTLTFDPVTQNQ